MHVGASIHLAWQIAPGIHVAIATITRAEGNISCRRLCGWKLWHRVISIMAGLDTLLVPCKTPGKEERHELPRPQACT